MLQLPSSTLTLSHCHQLPHCHPACPVQTDIPQPLPFLKASPVLPSLASSALHPPSDLFAMNSARCQAASFPFLTETPGFAFGMLRVRQELTGKGINIWRAAVSFPVQSVSKGLIHKCSARHKAATSTEEGWASECALCAQHWIRQLLFGVQNVKAAPQQTHCYGLHTSFQIWTEAKIKLTHI